MISLDVNGKVYELDIPLDTPLLWVLRDHLDLKGTKYGCGVGECGTCTVHVDGKAERSCSITVGDVQRKKITTIEGLPQNHREAGLDQGAGPSMRLLPARGDHASGRSSIPATHSRR